MLSYLELGNILRKEFISSLVLLIFRYPGRRQPNYRAFSAVHQRLLDTGSVMPQQRHERGGATLAFTEEVLEKIDENPSTSTRAIASSLNSSKTTVWRVLKEQLLYPYHRQKVQLLQAGDDAQRVRFCNFLRVRRRGNADFQQTILWTDEATFHRDGFVNFKNQHEWNEANPHAVVHHGAQHRFSINLWAGIVDEYLLGPYILPPRLNGQTYLTFLQQQLPEFLDDLPLALRSRLWFQHDGAPSHFVQPVRDYLDIAFPNQ